MGRSKETFGKREKEKKRLKKRQDKQLKKEERKANSKGGGLENMIAYVDEEGNILETPPDPTQKKKVKLENIEIGVPKREKTPEDDVHSGKVEFYNIEKGYGFIRDLGNNEKYFVHASGCLEEINEGDSVEYELVRGVKGLNAVKVKLK